MATDFQSLSPIYLITKEMEQTNTLIDRVHFLLDCGINLIQYRQKNLPEEIKNQQAYQLKKISQSYGAKLIINDDLELTKKIAADGIHLGESDRSIELAEQSINQTDPQTNNLKNNLSERKNQRKLIGVSCYNDIERVKKFITHPSVDLISIGAIFCSKTKPDAKRADLKFVKEVLELQNQIRRQDHSSLTKSSVKSSIKSSVKNSIGELKKIPQKKIYAIGGITSENFDQVMAVSSQGHRLDGICLCADLFDSNRQVLKIKIKKIQQYFNPLH